MSKPRGPWEFEDPSCAEIGVEAFYLPDKDEALPGTFFNYDAIKRVCFSCKHQVECADWGIKKETWGIWGGYTPLERKRIRKVKRIKFADGTHD